jgi:NADPH:quinone reductase-like Zn-dependent oxidoreductase
MQAIVQDSYGSADVLQLRDIDPPGISDNEVLVRVHAAGVDPGVWHLMTGLPYLVRLMGYGLRTPKTEVLGFDVAGRVDAVGANVTQLEEGDEVFGTCSGSFAEYACAKDDNLALKPAALSFEQAAAVPVSGFTALQGIRDQGRVQAGQRVLVIGASGGVGTFAVQIAKSFGAEVTGVCSTTKVELVRSIGADHVIDYTRQDFAESGERWDLILDTAGARPVPHLRRALTHRGTLVIVGAEGGNRWTGGIGRQLRAAALSPFVRHNLRMYIAQSNRKDLQLLKELVESGKVTPVVDRTYPLADTADAIRYLARGHARGKVVISVSPSAAPE